MKKKLLTGVFLGSLAVILSSCDGFNIGKPVDTETTVDIVSPTETVSEKDEKYRIYLLAAKSGYEGTYQEWLDSIRGASIALQVSNGYIQMKYSDKAERINLISLDELRGETGLSGKTTELKVSNGFIQWKYTDEDNWKNLISLSAITGADGKAGKEVEISANNQYIVWKYTDSDIWRNLVSLESLKGDRGVSISKVEINSDGDLIISYSDGSIGNAGKVKEATSFDNTYTVTFDSNGGNEVSSQIVPWGGGPKVPEDPTKEGYQFLGWYYGDRQWDFFTNYYPYDMTLTAKWGYADYKCTLHPNGGEVSSSEVTAYYSCPFELETPTRPGYKFLGWYDEDDQKVEISTWTYKTNMDFYAKWEQNPKVTITFDANGGSLDIDSEEVVIGSYYEAPIPTNGNIPFVGWYDEDGVLYEDGYFNYESDIVLKAKWGNKYDAIEDKNITVWISDNNGYPKYTEEKIQSYLESLNLTGFNITVLPMSSYSAMESLGTTNSAPEIFMLAGDQIPRAVNLGYVSKVPSVYAESITNGSLTGAVNMVTVNNDIYAYPMTLDNGFFMWYDKSKFEGVDMNSLEAIIARCEETNTKFSFNLSGAWYLSSFFFATGCTSEWIMNDEGTIVDFNDTFNSDAGYVALKEVYDLISSNCFRDSMNSSDFGDSVNTSSVVLSGTWSKTEACAILGDNCAACKLPSFIGCDGKTYQLGSFGSGNALCVTPQEDALKEELLNEIATYLSSEALQVENYERFGFGPSNINASKNDALENDIAIQAILEQSEYFVPQRAIHGDWWNIANELYTGAKNSDGSESVLKAILQAYKDELDDLLVDHGYVLAGEWQEWNNKDNDSIMNHDGSEWSITFTISSDLSFKGGRIVEYGSWNGVAGYSNVSDASKALLDITACEENMDDMIVFAEGGNYTLVFNENTGVITITKNS